MMPSVTDAVKEIMRMTEDIQKDWQKSASDVDLSRLVVACEALEILKSYLQGEKDFGDLLDFDIDKKYLS